MKKTTIPLCLLFMLFYPLNSWGVTKDVTVTWAMPDATNVTGYKMYYSYNSTMTGQLLACETSDKAATSLTCPGLELTSSPVYVVIAAVTTTGEENSPPTSQTFTAGISIVQEFTLEASASQPPPAPTADYKINFQPADAAVPAGYSVDSGDSFTDSREYGWTGLDSSGTRDRDNIASPDQRYDTMVHVNPSSVWEMTVPNGSYSVTICNGDASYPTGTQNVQTEGITVIDSVALSSTAQWVERTATVSVTDGKLSVTFTGSTDPARLCWLTITSIN